MLMASLLFVLRHGTVDVAELEAGFELRVEADWIGAVEGLETVAVVVGRGEELIYVAVDWAEDLVAVCGGGEIVRDWIFEGVGRDVETEDGGIAAREV